MTLDCRICGACCAKPGLVGCSLADVASFPPGVRWHQTAAYRGLELLPDGRCYALAGDVGQQVTCSIYEHRPAVCKAVKPGDTFCLASRAEVGLP